MGLDTDDILSIFDNKDVRKNIQAIHGKVSIPHHGLTSGQLKEHIRIIKELSQALTVDTSQGRFPSYSAEDYHQALFILTQAKILTPENVATETYAFGLTRDKVVAKAVLRNMHEAAQSLANPRYKDPARTKYIDEGYANLVTSEVITAFIQTLEVYPIGT